MEKRSFSLTGHRTSVALEYQFWAVLEDLAYREQISLVKLIARIDDERLAGQGLASALRVLALLSIRELNRQVTERPQMTSVRLAFADRRTERASSDSVEPRSKRNPHA